jgi:3-hydroxybutyryl-CoA dehydratase
MEHAREIAFQTLREGYETEHEYTLSPALYQSFVTIVGDRNPLHVDAMYAREKGFEGPVMHGAMLNGLLSHFVGMVCPGRNSILLSADMRYLKPCYLNDRIALVAKVSHTAASEKAVELRIEFVNRTQKYTAAKAKVLVGMLDG